MQTRTTSPTRRPGFTLIELLVVIAIIAVLAALGAGAYFRVRASQQEKLTGETVTKLQKMLRQQWTATLDNAKKEPIPDIVKAYCQNDPDKAAAVWGYLHLRRDFPESVLEAQALPPAVPAGLSPGIYLGTTRVLVRNEAVWNAVSTVTGTVDEQSAACIYASLTLVNRRGMESGITDNMTMNWPSGVATTAQYKVFADTFGRPIAFRRFLTNSEMQAMPFAKAGTANRDPLDPLGKLKNLPVTNRAVLEAAIGGNRLFNDTNFMPSVFSYGLNKKLDFSGTEPIGDDILGYRLETEGKIN